MRDAYITAFYFMIPCFEQQMVVPRNTTQFVLHMKTIPIFLQKSVFYPAPLLDNYISFDIAVLCPLERRQTKRAVR